MTLKEIAQEAGVSISTVSRVINQGNSNVAAKKYRIVSGKLYGALVIFPIPTQESGKTA